MSVRRLLASLLVLPCLVGCSKDEDPAPAPTPTITTYRGVLVGPNAEQGTVTFTITASSSPALGAEGPPLGIEALAHEHPVSGNLHFNGNSAQNVSGTYDTHSGSLTATGGGYIVNGTVLSGTLAGTYSAGTTGAFVAVVPTSSTPTAFCGAWTATAGTAGNGLLSLVVDGTTITGMARHDSDGQYNAVTGAVSGNDVIWTFESYSATGVRSGATMSGNYQTTLQGGGTGSWETTAVAF